MWGVRVFFPNASPELTVDIDQLDIGVADQSFSASAEVTVGSDRLEVQLRELSAVFTVGTGTLGFANASGEFEVGQDGTHAFFLLENGSCDGRGIFLARGPLHHVREIEKWLTARGTNYPTRCIPPSAALALSIVNRSNLL